MSESEGPAEIESGASIDVREKNDQPHCIQIDSSSNAGDSGIEVRSFFLCRNLILCSQPRASSSSRAVFSLVESAGAEASGRRRCDHRGREARANFEGGRPGRGCRLTTIRITSAVRCGGFRSRGNIASEGRCDAMRRRTPVRACASGS
jgi:hypothetical protein